MVILYLLLTLSQRQQGIIFASDINDLPLSQVFGYLYLPNILAVIYSFIWSWIDLDAKRLEPYYQLSKDGGASAKDSLLLHYPFDFVAAVPLKAMKRGHWPVFFASTAMVLVFWGVTPSQAGIFGTESVTRTSPMPILVSTSYTTFEQQQSGLTSIYAQSVYNIAWLNETPPAFMTRDYVLAPFGPKMPLSSVEHSETWTAPTQSYSVDVECEVAVLNLTDNCYTSSKGCSYDLNGQSVSPVTNATDYAGILAGYSTDAGNANFYLKGSCPPGLNQSFFVTWSKRLNATDINGYVALNTTALYCEPTYYQQQVNATVAPPQMTVLNAVPIGPKTSMPADMLNTGSFEEELSSTQNRFETRGDYPDSRWPDQSQRLFDWSPKFDQFWPDQRIRDFGIAVHRRSPDDYLNQSVLQETYQAAYRLLFVRHMSNILKADLDPGSMRLGERSYTTQSVVAVPAFIYVVEGLLGAVIVSTLVLLYLSVIRPRKLSFNPANIASLMSLVADSSPILAILSDKDRVSEQALHQTLRDTTFRLSRDDQSGSCRLEVAQEMIHPTTRPKDTMEQEHGPVRGVRPLEHRMQTDLMLLTLQVGILTTLVVLKAKIARSNGISLPTSNQFVRQLLENYLPMAFGTFIEPVWVVLNRLMCVLQPFEDLRRGKSTAARSMTIDYTSLPPQLVIWKALRARHILLGAICAMALLANVLAVALQRLLYENLVSIPYSTTFVSLYTPKLDGRSLGVASPSHAYVVSDHFNVALSNLTAGTAMPPWADDELFYMPFKSASDSNDIWLLAPPREHSGRHSILSAGIAEGAPGGLGFSGPPKGRVAFETIWSSGIFNDTEPELSVCQNYFVSGWARANNVSEARWGAPTSDSRNNQFQQNATIHDIQQTWVACRPRIVVGLADVTVDNTGRVITAHPLNGSSTAADPFFEANTDAFLSQVNPLFVWNGNFTWHDDSFSSDITNYLISKQVNSSSFVDPSLPPPLFDEIATALRLFYSKVFAIILGTNMDRILEPAVNATLPGYTIKLETRIFMSEPMFVISESIMALYIVVTILVYVRRPWRILPRLPTTIASVVAYFAASRAVVDLKGTAGMSVEERNEFVQTVCTGP
ncbi:hypothetical protein LTR04_005761 [Oleoguttula sp. CCFEE 6159]|nr:hypothetical protein LTR04_005761 [Oleoguttula sp. CCFEE 6159]